MSWIRFLSRRPQKSPQRSALRRRFLGGVELLEDRCLLAVHVLEAAANIEFVDMGYDPNTDEVGIVGYIDDGQDEIPTVFELNAMKDGFTSQTLADLPGATGRSQVFGISSDAYRIAGVSKSPGSVDIGQGVTWLKAMPDSPVGIGYISGLSNTSAGVGAWKDGIVGQSGGALRAIQWSSEDGIQNLPGTNGQIAEAKDASSMGQVIVGFSSHEHFNGAAYYWDDAGIHRLDDSVPGFTLFQSNAYAVSPDGNNIGGYVAVEDGIGTVFVYAAIWEGPERTLRILEDAAGNKIEGVVQDISNSGYAVGNYSGGGFIWHSSFTGVKLFEDWLVEQQPNYSPVIDSEGIVAISEDRVHGKLRFALSAHEAVGASYYAEVDLPEIAVPEDVLAYDQMSGTFYLGANQQPDLVFSQTATQWDASSDWLFFPSDLNQDGTQDVIGYRTAGPQAGRWQVGVIDGNELITTNSFSWNTAQGWSDFVSGDFNGDGISDVTARSANGQWWTFTQTENGPTSLYLGQWNATGWSNVTSGDFNSDGLADIAGMDAAGQWWIGYSNGNRLNTRYAGRWTPNATANYQQVHVGDFNGDQQDDVALQDGDGKWWWGLTTGADTGIPGGQRFEQVAGHRWDAGSQSEALTVDVDGDGRTDLLAHDNTGQWWVLRLHADGVKTTYWGRWDAGDNWSLLAGDFNRDGRTDIVGYATSTQTWYLSLNENNHFNQRTTGQTTSPLNVDHLQLI